MRLWGVGLLHLAVALSLSQLPAGAQTAGSGAQASPSSGVPRTRDGKPDLSGILAGIEHRQRQPPVPFREQGRSRRAPTGDDERYQPIWVNSDRRA